MYRLNSVNDKIIEKDKELAKVLNNKKILERLYKEKEMEHETLKSEINLDSKIANLNEQVKQLKEQLRELTKQEKRMEQYAKTRNDYLVSLEEKYRIVLEKTGYIPEEDRFVQKTKWDPKKLDALKRKKAVMDMNWKPNPSEKEEEDEDLGPLTEQKMIELREKIKKIKKEEKTNEAYYKKDLADLREQLKQALEKRKEAEKRLSDREKVYFQKKLSEIIAIKYPCFKGQGS